MKVIEEKGIVYIGKEQKERKEKRRNEEVEFIL